jgi:hypothetical protein
MAVRERSFLSYVGLIGAVALFALVWMFAIAIFGTLVIAAALTAAKHRSTRRR